MLTKTQRDAIIGEVNNTYTINSYEYEIVKQSGRVPILTANLKDKVNLFYFFPRDHIFKQGYGGIRILNAQLKFTLVSQLDDNYDIAKDKALELMKAILKDLRTNLDTTMNPHNVWMESHSPILDETNPDEKELLFVRLSSMLNLAYTYLVG